MVTRTTSMKYPQFHQIPKDAPIRFLPKSSDLTLHILEGESAMTRLNFEDPESYPRISFSKPRAPMENPFAPFPFVQQHSFEEMNAIARLRSMINVMEIKQQQIPTPVRKKKSWLRYSSNKKWARECPKRFIRKIEHVQVLSLPKSLMDKINALAGKNPLDAAFMNPRPKLKAKSKVKSKRRG